MSEQLEYRQIQFLKNCWEAKRSMEDIKSDLRITSDELADWKRKDKTFRRKLRNVELALDVVREMEIRRAATEASRRLAGTIFDLTNRIKNIWQMRTIKVAIEVARRIDPKIRKLWRRPLRPDDVCDPVHPAYRADAQRLFDEMDAIRKSLPKGATDHCPWPNGDRKGRGRPAGPRKDSEGYRRMER